VLKWCNIGRAAVAEVEAAVDMHGTRGVSLKDMLGDEVRSIMLARLYKPLLALSVPLLPNTSLFIQHARLLLSPFKHRALSRMEETQRVRVHYLPLPLLLTAHSYARSL
jgi:hypothetical protein